MFEGDDVSHESAQPLWVQEIQLTQLGLQITVVENNPTLVQELDGLMKLRFVHLEIQFILFDKFTESFFSQHREL